MISVLNRQRLLNGSNSLFLVGIFLLALACGSTKNTTQPPVVDDPDPPVVDVPDVTVDVTPDDTIEIEQPDLNPIEDRVGPQTSMRLALLLPLGAEDYYTSDYTFTGDEEKFIQFYQGALLALNEMRLRNVHVLVETIDTKSGGDPFQLLDQFKPDIVLGAYEGKMIKELARWAKENRTIAISPWRSSSSVADDNPYFVQISPTLDQYLHALAKYVSKNYSDNQVVLIGKDDDKDRELLAKVQNFKQDALLNTSASPWKEFYLDPEDFEADKISEIEWGPLEELFNKSGRTVFLVPHYRSKAWIKDAINKIAAVKDLNKLTVFGMSNWMDMEDISFSQRIFLDLHLPVFQQIDHRNAEVKYLDRTYLNEYSMLPTSEEAYLGYDLVQFITQAWRQHGENAILESSRKAYKGKTLELDIQPIYRAAEDMNVDYFQNVLIQMYRYTKDGLRLSTY